jgi:glucose 1-dehydrogenase
MELRRKTALVTGAARGIGRGCAVELARLGANVVVNYIADSAEAESVAEECRAAGGQAMTHRADVGDFAAVDKLFDAALERFGSVDILVNNAYRSIRKPCLELTLDDVQEVWRTSLLAPFYASQRAAREMVRQGRGGRIIMISSVLVAVPLPNSLPYNTAKAGLEAMARTLATELAPHRICVNSVEPGWTDTPGERAFITEEDLQSEARKLPFGRLAEIWEIGTAVAYLASPAAEYITGTMLRVDGGYCLPRAAAPVNRPEAEKA